MTEPGRVGINLKIVVRAEAPTPLIAKDPRIIKDNENRAGFAPDRELPAHTLWRNGADRLVFDRRARSLGSRGYPACERRFPDRSPAHRILPESAEVGPGPTRSDRLPTDRATPFRRHVGPLRRHTLSHRLSAFSVFRRRVSTDVDNHAWPPRPAALGGGFRRVSSDAVGLDF